MTYMPVWYQQGRSALLLLQSVIGLLLVSYPLKRRSHFYPRPCWRAARCSISPGASTSWAARPWP